MRYALYIRLFPFEVVNQIHQFFQPPSVFPLKTNEVERKVSILWTN